MSIPDYTAKDAFIKDILAQFKSEVGKPVFIPSLDKNGVVVGYDSKEDRSIVYIPGAKCSYRPPLENVHSDYEYLIGKEELFIPYEHNIHELNHSKPIPDLQRNKEALNPAPVAENNDALIVEDLKRLGFHIGQHISWELAPDREASIAGCTKHGDLVLRFDDTIEGPRNNEYVYDGRQHPITYNKEGKYSGYHPSEKTYFHVRPSSVKPYDPKKAMEYKAGIIIKEMLDSDIKISEELKKLGLLVGQEVCYAGLPGGKQQVIGYSDGQVILRSPGKEKDNRIAYYDIKSRHGLNSSFSQEKLCFRASSFTLLPYSEEKVVIYNKSQKHQERINQITKEFSTWFDQNAKKTLKTKTTNKAVSPVKKELREAGYRIAATQSINFSRNAIVAALEKVGADNAYIQSLSALLSNEYGRAMIAMTLGLALPQIPAFEKDERLAKLTREFRIGGLTIAGNEIADAIFSSAFDAFTAAPETQQEEEDESHVRLSEHCDKDTLIHIPVMIDESEFLEENRKHTA